MVAVIFFLKKPADRIRLSFDRRHLSAHSLKKKRPSFPEMKSLLRPENQRFCQSDGHNKTHFSFVVKRMENALYVAFAKMFYRSERV